MRKALIVAAAVAVTLLGLAAAPAGAASLEVSPAGAITETSLGKLTFAAGELTAECNFTMSGSLLRGPIAKTTGSRLGEISSVRWANCVGGEIETVEGLPWSVSYESISGTLPERVTSVTKSYQISLVFSGLGGFVNCVYRGVARFATALTQIIASKFRSGLNASQETPIPLIRGFGCPVEGKLRGSFSSTTQTVTRG